jgi:penicillin-binding protein 2
MAQVTEPGEFHTAGSAHLEGIDFAGKTGTAQQMSHEAMAKSGKGKSTIPTCGLSASRRAAIRSWWLRCCGRAGNSATTRRASEPRSWKAYVDKKRRLAGNLPPPKAAAPPVEVGAVWTTPGVETKPGTKNTETARTRGQIHSGHFFVKNGQIVAANPAGR